MKKLYYVSIHAPTRGATVYPRRRRYWKRFQSTRPRGARLILAIFTPPTVVVSIHAPTRGATGASPLFLQPWRVSIHAPTRGATCILGIIPGDVIVSIHAPTRGATLLGRICRRLHHSFNPRAHAGRDLRAILNLIPHSWFQSTRPRGARLSEGVRARL